MVISFLNTPQMGSTRWPLHPSSIEVLLLRQALSQSPLLVSLGSRLLRTRHLRPRQRHPLPLALLAAPGSRAVVMTTGESQTGKAMADPRILRVGLPEDPQATQKETEIHAVRGAILRRRRRLRRLTPTTCGDRPGEQRRLCS